MVIRLGVTQHFVYTRLEQVQDNTSQRPDQQTNTYPAPSPTKFPLLTVRRNDGMRKTPRGFKIYSEFTDTYKSDVSIVESSSVLKRCWIFVENDGKKQGSNLVTDGAIHLDTRQARLVISALQKFIKS